MGADAGTVDTDVLRSLIRDIPDFPSPGVVFKDITPLLADADAFRATVDGLADRYAGERVDKVLGIEARGFIVAAPVARRLGVGFVPVRKAGKLPWQVEKEEYVLEYGTGYNGDNDDARLALREAKTRNAHVADFLIGTKSIPEEIAEQEEPGDEAEAVLYMDLMGEAWNAKKGAREWVRRHTVTTPTGPPVKEKRSGPREI